LFFPNELSPFIYDILKHQIKFFDRQELNRMVLRGGQSTFKKTLDYFLLVNPKINLDDLKKEVNTIPSNLKNLNNFSLKIINNFVTLLENEMDHLYNYWNQYISLYKQKLFFFFYERKIKKSKKKKIVKKKVIKKSSTNFYNIVIYNKFYQKFSLLKKYELLRRLNIIKEPIFHEERQKCSLLTSKSKKKLTIQNKEPIDHHFTIIYIIRMAKSQSF
jgi:hypothetical protein